MMAVLLIFAAYFLATGFALNLSCDIPYEDNYHVPIQLDGKFNYGWVSGATVENDYEKLKQTKDLVQYYLYTKDNPASSQLLILNDISSLEVSNFNSSNPTRIISHGILSTHMSDVCTMIRDAYLQTGPHNIITIDYSKISNSSFPVARFCLPSVGNDLGEFINFLVEDGGLSMKDLIVIGHSLGSHLLGFAGKFLKKSNNTLPLIIACDPSHSLFSYADCSSRLCNTDADFVESIQTNAGKIGFYEPIGDGTYYPNGGMVQPGCGSDELGTCAHLKSFKYLAEAIVYKDFPSKKCQTFLNALSNECGHIDDSLKMGSMESIGKKGIFYVPVNSELPYGNATTS